MVQIPVTEKMAQFSSCIMGCVGLCLTPVLPKLHVHLHKDMDQDLGVHSPALLPYLYSLWQSATAEIPPSDEQGQSCFVLHGGQVQRWNSLSINLN